MPNKFSGLFGDKLLNDLLEGRERLTAHQGRPIDHKARCALHANLPSETRLLLDDLGILTRIHAIVEGFRIQSQFFSKFLKIVFAEGALILAILTGEQKIMVFPEFVLIRGALGRLRRPLGFIA
jgi:hypothetical protein